jgi:hypothetical protein
VVADDVGDRLGDLLAEELFQPRQTAHRLALGEMLDAVTRRARMFLRLLDVGQRATDGEDEMLDLGR